MKIYCAGVIKKAVVYITRRPWLLPDVVLEYLLFKLKLLASRRTDSFRWRSAFFYPRVNIWQRYAPVAQQIKLLGEKHIRILEVGAGWGDIRDFLNPKEYRLCVLDIEYRAASGALERVSKHFVEILAGDGSNLPFKEGSFDVVTSVDSLEHVPDSRREVYCQELKRVASGLVIMTCPADSDDGVFQGTTYDMRFLDWYRNRFGEDESNIREHYRLGLPRVEGLERIFPGASIEGNQSCDIWLKIMIWRRTPYIRLLVGLLYKLYLNKKDNIPPYHSCLLVWRNG